MFNPKVAIITPTRMRPDFLRRAIISVQSQTFKDYEHVIVADHCLGYSREVYEQFKDDERIKFLEINDGKYIKNNGSDGRNLAIDNSTAPFITYLDDDDTLLPDHLHTLYNNIIFKELHLLYNMCYLMNYEQEIMVDNKEFDVILKRHIHDYEGYQHKFHGTLMNGIHSRAILEKVGKWNPEGNNVVSDFMHRLRIATQVDFIDGCTSIVNSYGGAIRHQTSYAKKIYLEKLECMRPDQIYVYEEFID